jgi:hypothetical protein
MASIGNHTPLGRKAGGIEITVATVMSRIHRVLPMFPRTLSDACGERTMTKPENTAMVSDDVTPLITSATSRAPVAQVKWVEIAIRVAWEAIGNRWTPQATRSSYEFK